MEQILDFINPVMAALIVALAEGLKAVYHQLTKKELAGQLASVIATVVVGGAWFLFDDGISIVEGFISFLGAVAAYDFAIKPLKGGGVKQPPTGGGGLPPKPY